MQIAIPIRYIAIVAVLLCIFSVAIAMPKPIAHSAPAKSEPSANAIQYRIAIDCQNIASNAHDPGWSYQGCVDEVQKSVDTMRHVYTSSKNISL